jgi:hypothetical protein
MDERQRCLAWGVYLSATTYLVLVFIAGILTVHPVAWRLSILTAGLNYLAYTTQLANLRSVAIVLVSASAVTGAAAGILLLLV